MLKDTPLTITELVPDDLIDALVEKAGIKKIEMHADRVLGGPPLLHTCTMVHFREIPGDIAQFQTNMSSEYHDGALLSALERASEASEHLQPFLVIRILSELSRDFHLPRGADVVGFLQQAHTILGSEMRVRVPIISLIFADSTTLKKRGEVGILELLPKPGETYPQMLKTILSMAKNEPPISLDDKALYSDTSILARGANAFIRKVAVSLNQEEEFSAWAEELRWQHANYSMPGLRLRNITSQGDDLQATHEGRRSHV
ncbi:MAG TPA: hypothetical protein VGZ00_01170 [Candidatus Baltobacteraceae bacterium]|jgi:hypothetical protein|nr:hypothetical protein [Candidatus Baltobacteraceae bacterium]